MKSKEKQARVSSFVYFFSISLLFFVSSCNIEVNQNVRIENGEKYTDDINTVNGSIIIGKNCAISGDCRSINGSLEVGAPFTRSRLPG